MTSLTVRLTGVFKVHDTRGATGLDDLFAKFKELVNELLDYSSTRSITAFKRLKGEKYHELRSKHPELPSHYIYTACQMASSIYRSFRKLKRRGKARGDKPFFRRNVVMLDDHLLSLDLERWEASVATENGRRVLGKLLHGTYHEKFRDMRAGEAWLVKGEEHGSLYLKAVFSGDVEVADPNGSRLAVDINENNVTFGTEKEVNKLITKEKAMRTGYFLKRRRLQSASRLNEKPIMSKYCGREARRVEAVYHRAANAIVKKAKEEHVSQIVLEKLRNIRNRIAYRREMNGRLHRWSFRRLQSIIEYKAKVTAVSVVYVDASYTSRLCPTCGDKLSLRGYRVAKCVNCGLEEDRDVVAVKNLLQRDVPTSTVQGESSPMTISEERRPSSCRSQRWVRTEPTWL